MKRQNLLIYGISWVLSLFLWSGVSALGQSVAPATATFAVR